MFNTETSTSSPSSQRRPCTVLRARWKALNTRREGLRGSVKPAAQVLGPISCCPDGKKRLSDWRWECASADRRARDLRRRVAERNERDQAGAGRPGNPASRPGNPAVSRGPNMRP
eukprot:6887844-Pyramimonas_sp.AAC.2